VGCTDNKKIVVETPESGAPDSECDQAYSLLG